jgi:hypothetical protein
VRLPRHEAARYLTPLKEGGSLPAVVESASGELWVVKFRGAGQGPKALIAEVIVAGLAGALGLAVPDVAVVELDESFGRGERDPEIQDVLRASHGVNVALRYLDGAFNLDPRAVPEAVGADFATRLVWLDALVTNPDRTARNPNLMLWQGRTWLIDHGAALFDHHNWARVDEERTRRPFTQVADHLLLPWADDLAAADAALAAQLTDEVVRASVQAVPDELLMDSARPDPSVGSAEQARQRYVDYLGTRLREPRAFATEAETARKARAGRRPIRLESRR